MNELKGIKAALFDLDGTVYIDGVPIGDSPKTLDYLRGKGIKVGFLTNNSSRSDDEYKKLLESRGIAKKGDYILSSLSAATEYLNTEHAGKKIYALATNVADEYMRGHGVNLLPESRSDEAEVLLLAFDKEITYNKIERANRLLCRGVKYIATHPDKVCPAKECSVPDAGAFIELFKASSGRTPDVIIGKPYPFMAEKFCRETGFSPENVLMVGDRLYTDIKFGVNAGLKTVLVLSGETSLSDYENSEIKAAIVIPDMNALKDYL